MEMSHAEKLYESLRSKEIYGLDETDAQEQIQIALSTGNTTGGIPLKSKADVGNYTLFYGIWNGKIEYSVFDEQEFIASAEIELQLPEIQKDNIGYKTYDIIKNNEENNFKDENDLKYDELKTLLLNGKLTQEVDHALIICNKLIAAYSPDIPTPIFENYTAMHEKHQDSQWMKIFPSFPSKFLMEDSNEKVIFQNVDYLNDDGNKEKASDHGWGYSKNQQKIVVMPRMSCDFEW
jgi:hypothetical protein